MGICYTPDRTNDSGGKYINFQLMLEIIPAILTNNPEELKEKIKQVEGLARRVQIDVVDGVFAKNKTVGLEGLEEIETNLFLDIQLMVKEPVDWVERCANVLADRVIGHVEMMSSQEEFLKKVAESGAKVGLGLDLDTPVEAIEENLLTSLDVVLVMSVKAGFGGQEFETRVLEKVEKLRILKTGDPNPFSICVDGGVSMENTKQIIEAGADEVVVGHSLWEGNLEENIGKLKEGLNAV